MYDIIKVSVLNTVGPPENKQKNLKKGLLEWRLHTERQSQRLEKYQIQTSYMNNENINCTRTHLIIHETTVKV